jgi:hypothetical protein
MNIINQESMTILSFSAITHFTVAFMSNNITLCNDKTRTYAMSLISTRYDVAI